MAIMLHPGVRIVVQVNLPDLSIATNVSHIEAEGRGLTVGQRLLLDAHGWSPATKCTQMLHGAEAVSR